MNRLTRTFLRGLLTLLPIFLCLYFLYWFLASAEVLFRQILIDWIPMPYLPGMGILAGLIIIFAVGALMSSERIQKLFMAIEMPFKNVPIVKSIYSAMKDLTHFFSSTEQRSNKVVLVKFPQLNVQLIGFVTNESLHDMPDNFIAERRVAVYLPMSYQLGGYTVFVPRSWLEEVNISVEKAMRSAVTAWMPTAKGDGS